MTMIKSAEPPSRHHKLGPKGQVVIPKAMRDALGLHPGDPVDFQLNGLRITIEPARPNRPLGGRFKGVDLLSGLLEDRAKERARDRADERGTARR